MAVAACRELPAEGGPGLLASSALPCPALGPLLASPRSWLRTQAQPAWVPPGFRPSLLKYLELVFSLLPAVSLSAFLILTLLPPTPLPPQLNQRGLPLSHPSAPSLKPSSGPGSVNPPPTSSSGGAWSRRVCSWPADTAHLSLRRWPRRPRSKRLKRTAQSSGLSLFVLPSKQK